LREAGSDSMAPEQGSKSRRTHPPLFVVLHSRQVFRACGETTLMLPPTAGRSAAGELRRSVSVFGPVLLQGVCPANAARHFAVGTYDPVAYALVVDALTHSGRGAAAERLSKAVCHQRLAPGVDPRTFARDLVALYAHVGSHKGVGRFSRTEPPLAP